VVARTDYSSVTSPLVNCERELFDLGRHATEDYSAWKANAGTMMRRSAGTDFRNMREAPLEAITSLSSNYGTGGSSADQEDQDGRPQGPPAKRRS
jgi:hypothetical protein